MNTTRASLLARLKDVENSKAWGEFDHIYRPMLYRFVHKCGISGPTADDVTQDCMAAVVQHIGNFDHQPGRGAFRAWLRTMVINRVLNMRRSRREAQADSKDLRDIVDDEPSPEEIFDQVSREEYLRYCIEEVKKEVEPSTFEAFKMHVLDEKPVEEVCSVLQMTPNQVYKIKWRMTRKVAEKMKDLDF